ncbi:protein MMS22-like [Anopheles albimanus]|uniref:Protein MMS22-like n=1 Tax=Anopheles albimanus TaxID=7167 RepID=A0A182FC60_ANOAL|nr:protein MMS22-like [Anopheles albimanus]
MFECHTNRCTAFARDAGRSLCGASAAAVPPDDSGIFVLFDVELCELYDTLLYDLCKMVHDRLTAIKFSYELTVRNARTQRQEVTRFLRLAVDTAVSMRGEKLNEAVSLLSNCMPRLVEPLFKYGRNSVHDQESEGYELYHAGLEWRWLVLLLASEATVEESCEPSSTVTSVGKESTKSRRKRRSIHATFRALYRDMMVDLLELVFQLFRINTVDSLVDECPFQCGCLRSMWVGLMSLAERSNGQLQFWTSMDECLPTVLNGRTDGYLLKLWLINGLAGLMVNDVPTLAVDGQAQAFVDELLNEVLRADCREEQMRVVLVLLCPIISGRFGGSVRHEPIIALWAYFSARLNSPFLLKSDSIASRGCVSQSIAGFIEQAQELVLAASEHQTLRTGLDARCVNSFRMFLMMLAFVIQHFTREANKKKVQIIFNRVFVKLAPNKYVNMTEQAIYNLGLMLSTMTVATGYPEDYPRVSRHMQMVPFDGGGGGGGMKQPVDVAIRRIVMATQAHMALLVLFSSAPSFDKTGHVLEFMRSFEEAHQKYGQRLLPAMSAIAEGVLLLFEKAASRGSFERGELSLIDAWLTRYLHGPGTGWHRLLDALTSAMAHTASHSSNRALTEAIMKHVFPFVKEQFMKSDPAPSSIARLAAQLTLNAKTGDAGEMMSFLALFNTFTGSSTADSQQLLDYLREIVTSSRMQELDERVIVRLWLKLALYYGAQELRDLTRAVYRLDEFRALCDIPEYDLLETDAVPMHLFLRHVGKRFRETHDGNEQLQLKMRLHHLFQHFDRWIPEPTGIVRQRILSVLVLALKECDQAFYIRSNPSCLYHLAFQQYFLPVSVLTDRQLAADYVEDMARVWHRVMDVLSRMAYQSDSVIGDRVINMLTKWLPQFAKLPSKAPREMVRPLLLFFSGSGTNEALVKYAMPRVASTFVELQRCLPKPNALPVMRMLQWLLQELIASADYAKVALFERLLGLPIVMHAVMCSASQPTRGIATTVVYDMVASTSGPSNMVRDEMRTVLANFTRRYLPIAADAYFVFMCRLADRNPLFIRSLIDTVREELVQAERLRGTGTDSFLRKSLYRLEGAVEASTAKLTTTRVENT